MPAKEISTFHVVLLFMMCIGLLNHVIIIPPLLDSAGRDAWLSVLFAYALFLIWALLIYYIIRATKQESLFIWLKTTFGKPLAYILISCLALYLMLSNAVTLKDLVLWTKITYLPRTPQIIITVSFLLLCLSMAKTSLRTIAIVNGILLPVVIILGFFVMSSNFPKKDYSLLFPNFEFGVLPVTHGMIYVGAGFAEVLTILFIQHRLKTKINYLSLAIIGAILTWLTLGPTMGALAAFGPGKASEMRFPAFEQWALVSLGRFVEHVDFFSIYQWLSGAFVRISLALFMIIELFNLQGKQRNRMLLASGTFIFGLNLLPILDYQYIFWLARYILPSFFIYLFSLSLLLGLIAFLGKKKNIQQEVKDNV